MGRQTRDVDITYKQHARIKYNRVRTFEQFKTIAWVLLNCSILSIIVGVVILVVGKDAERFPIRSGSPIWSGLIVIIVCVFAFIVGCYNPHYFSNDDSKKLRSWLLAYAITAFIAVLFCLISLGFTIHGAVRCVNWKYEDDQLRLYCGTNYDVQIVMQVAACLLSIFTIIFLIYGLILYFVCTEVYKFYDWETAYYDDYFYTVPGGQRVIENVRYATTNKPQLVEDTHYVTADKPQFDVVEGSVMSNDDRKPASVVSEYNTSNHKYLVLRLDRNQVRPM